MMMISGDTPMRSLFALGLASLIAAGAAGGVRADELSEAIKLTKPILDMRLRYEHVEQVPFVNEADAVTLRTRFGFETGKAWGTSFLAEGTWTTPFDHDFNSTTNGKTTFPIVADPTALRLNRLQITNISIPYTAITVGRQRINLDDQRFVGAVNWRQTEQTYDAVRVVTKPFTGFTLDGTYLDRVNRVYGPDSAQGRYKGDSYLVNASYVTDWGKLTGFAYLLQFDPIKGFTPDRDSSQTYGGRFAGTKEGGGVKWAYVASYATQKNYKNNPLRYSDDYYLLDLSGTVKQLTLGAGYEVLEGTGVKGFTTPLATLHKWDGWAEKFLTDPPNGVKDLYFDASVAQKNLGPFALVSLSAIYHHFNADHISLHYGDETDLELYAKWQRFGFRLTFADYRHDKLFTNTTKVWGAVEYIF